MNKLIYCIDDQLAIYRDDLGTTEMRAGAYCGDVKLKSSLLQILPLFELSVDVILGGIQDSSMEIGSILPFNDIITFLVVEMKSSYWYGLVCVFLLDNRVHILLSENAIKCLEDRQLISWLPQKEKHLTMKVLAKMRRL